MDQTLKQLVPQQQPRCWHESCLPLPMPMPMHGRRRALGQLVLPWCQGPSLCKAVPSLTRYMKALRYLRADTGQLQSWLKVHFYILTFIQDSTFALSAVWTIPAGATAAAVLVLALEAGAGACATPT